MVPKNTAALRAASPYNAAITREQFLFYYENGDYPVPTESLEQKQTDIFDTYDKEYVSGSIRRKLTYTLEMAL